MAVGTLAVNAVLPGIARQKILANLCSLPPMIPELQRLRKPMIDELITTDTVLTPCH